MSRASRLLATVVLAASPSSLASTPDQFEQLAGWLRIHRERVVRVRAAEKAVHSLRAERDLCWQPAVPAEALTPPPQAQLDTVATALETKVAELEKVLTAKLPGQPNATGDPALLHTQLLEMEGTAARLLRTYVAPGPSAQETVRVLRMKDRLEHCAALQRALEPFQLNDRTVFEGRIFDQPTIDQRYRQEFMGIAAGARILGSTTTAVVNATSSDVGLAERLGGVHKLAVSLASAISPTHALADTRMVVTAMWTPENNANGWWIFGSSKYSLGGRLEIPIARPRTNLRTPDLTAPYVHRAILLWNFFDDSHPKFRATENCLATADLIARQAIPDSRATLYELRSERFNLYAACSYPTELDWRMGVRAGVEAAITSYGPDSDFAPQRWFTGAILEAAPAATLQVMVRGPTSNSTQPWSLSSTLHLGTPVGDLRYGVEPSLHLGVDVSGSIAFHGDSRDVRVLLAPSMRARLSRAFAIIGAVGYLYDAEKSSGFYSTFGLVLDADAWLTAEPPPIAAY